MTRRGLLIVLSAPSGTGKTTLVTRLVERVPRLVRSRSYTSRTPRPGEVDGVDYHFVAPARFRDMIEAGEFLEWADVFGRLYGTSAAATEGYRASGLDVVLVIDVQGGASGAASGPRRRSDIRAASVVRGAGRATPRPRRRPRR